MFSPSVWSHKKSIVAYTDEMTKVSVNPVFDGYLHFIRTKHNGAPLNKPKCGAFVVDSYRFCTEIVDFRFVGHIGHLARA